MRKSIQIRMQIWEGRSRVSRVITHTVNGVVSVKNALKCASDSRMLYPGSLLLLVLVIRYRNPDTRYHKQITRESFSKSEQLLYIRRLMWPQIRKKPLFSLRLDMKSNELYQ